MNSAKNRDYDAPFLDKEEQDFIEGFEAAIDRGELTPHSGEEIKAVREDWQAALESTLKRRAITLRLQERDIRRLKSQARELGLPYQTYISSVLHQLANGKISVG